MEKDRNSVRPWKEKEKKKGHIKLRVITEEKVGKVLFPLPSFSNILSSPLAPAPKF